MWDGALIKSRSTTQGIIALSSGEAEYYGIAKGTAIAIGIRNLLADIGVQVSIEVNTDASAAKGIACRRGAGKVRHIEVSQLWLQQKVLEGEIVLKKVAGQDNLADALTKGLDGAGIERHLSGTGQSIVEGRHRLMPAVAAEDIDLDIQVDEPREPGDASHGEKRASKKI